MPTPQENSLFVEQASCLFLIMVQHLSSKGFSFFSKHSSSYYKPKNWGGQDAHPTRKFTLCGTGILPVLDNGATSQ
jgi:hypothetical protein